MCCVALEIHLLLGMSTPEAIPHLSLGRTTSNSRSKATDFKTAKTLGRHHRPFYPSAEDQRPKHRPNRGSSRIHSPRPRNTATLRTCLSRRGALAVGVTLGKLELSPTDPQGNRFQGPTSSEGVYPALNITHQNPTLPDSQYDNHLHAPVPAWN
jgi:hypothetical protein